ncbi:hypothetical protein [Neolewinella agarilytica]|uniref:Uncharacterized protein n=1 Tax=Neolewinella agarilytica TaxID=478744 RepID=A0A1H9I6K1_9BACT|nr:hypothetical protein [Neolewinella agarilytica]SEQ70209.1 hypothetical protein SAMN05444359_11462 [Neolewinella agarilytica]
MLLASFSLLTGCQEKELLSPSIDNKEYVSFPTDNGALVIPLENGILHFPDVSTYLRVEDAVSSNEDRQISDEQLDEIEFNTSFHSMRRHLNSKLAPYLYGDMPFDELSSVVNENEGLLYMHEDLPFNVFADRTQRALLNKQGAVIIENDMIIYRKDREIHLPSTFEVDFENLPLESDPEKGIIVLKATYNQVGSQPKSMICTRPSGQPDQIQRFSEGPEVDRKKVTSLGGVRVGKKLVRNQGGFQSGVEWQFWYRYYSEQKSWARARWGNNWRQGTSAITTLKFTFGVGITSNSGGSRGSGRGWTQSNVRTITTNWNPYNVNFFTTPVSPGDANLIYDYDLRYVTSGVRDDNDNSERSFTFSCCPWTCENSGYDDI